MEQQRIQRRPRAYYEGDTIVDLSQGVANPSRAEQPRRTGAGNVRLDTRPDVRPTIGTRPGTRRRQPGHTADYGYPSADVQAEDLPQTHPPFRPDDDQDDPSIGSRQWRHRVDPTTRTGETMHSIPAQTRPVQKHYSRRNALLIFGGIAGVVGFMGFFKGRSYLQNQVFDPLAEGRQRSTSIEIVCGHNHDSKQHPTQLHAYLDQNCLVVVELPAGDAAKAHVTKSVDLRTLGYQGDPTLAVISMEAPIEANGKIPQITITLEGGVVNVLNQREHNLRLLMFDDGTAYRAITPPAQK